MLVKPCCAAKCNPLYPVLSIALFPGKGSVMRGRGGGGNGVDVITRHYD